MRSVLTLVIVTALAYGAAAAATPVRFSADIKEYKSEGVVYRRLVFQDDKRQVFYQPPAGWQCRLSEGRLQLILPGKTFAEAEISSTLMAEPKSFDEAGVGLLTGQVMSALPPESQQAAILSQQQNSILLNNLPSFELVVSYKVLGDTFQRSVLFINTPSNQLVFKMTARKSDFDQLYRAFRASVLTWEWQ